MKRVQVLRFLLVTGLLALLIVITERLWALGQTLSGVLSTLAGAWFLAFAVHPFIDMLHRTVFPAPIVRWVERRYGAVWARRMARWRLPFSVSVAVVYGIFIVVLVGMATISVAAVIPQTTDLIARLPAISAQIPNLIVQAWVTIAARFGFSPDSITSVVSTQEISSRATQLAGAVAQQALFIVTGTAQLIAQFFLMLILSLYIVTEGKMIERQVFALLPHSLHDFGHALLEAVDRAFGGYLRGYVLAALVRFAFSAVLFSIFQVNFGIVLALAYALLSLIPLIGSPVAILLAAVVALFVRPEAALPVTLILFVFDQLVAYVVVPRIMSDAVGVPGLIGLLSISIGVQLFGFWGLVFSVPTMGVVYTLLFDYYLPRRRRAEGLPEYDPEVEKLLRPTRIKPRSLPADSRSAAASPAASTATQQAPSHSK